MEKQLSELAHGDSFEFKGKSYVKLREVVTHEGYGHVVFDCKDEHGGHRPFRDDTEVSV